MANGKKKRPPRNPYYGAFGLGAPRRAEILRLAAEAEVDITTSARAIFEGVDALCGATLQARVALAAGTLGIKLPKSKK